MDGIQEERLWITDELQRLLAVLPAISELPTTDPARRAWMIWKRALLGQIRLLEIREREIQSEPYLWIELSRAEMDAVGFDIAESRDTPVDH